MVSIQCHERIIRRIRSAAFDLSGFGPLDITGLRMVANELIFFGTSGFYSRGLTMSEENKIAYHGTSIDPETFKSLNGILPKVGWQKNPEFAKQIANALPDDLQERIYSHVGPVLRGTTPMSREDVVRGPRGGLTKVDNQGDADPNLSVSLTWSPRVACFFPPKHDQIYIYVVNVKNLPYKDVDTFAKSIGYNRDYMKEIAVSNVIFSRIAGYFRVTRTPPPAKIEEIVGHKMKVQYEPFVRLVTNDELGASSTEEFTRIPKEEFTISESNSVVGTFRTTDSIPTKPKIERKKSF